MESVNELRELINDPEKRRNLIELISLASLLNHCIVDSNYRLSDSWVHPLRFTTVGERTIDACMKHYKRLKPNDVKMAVFLTIGCTEGLLIDISTDIDAVRQMISREVHQGRVRYPYIFGRELHDAAAELFPAQEQLNNSQTIKLLDRLPIGVFQEGRTVVGPYGCTYSDFPRTAGPHVYPPGYLCPEKSCTTIHNIRIETGYGVIQRARTKVRQYIERNYSKAADEHAALLSEAATLELLPISSFPTTNLIDVLSDGLSIDELRSMIDHLMRRTFKREGRKMDISKRLGAVITSPAAFVETLGRPELMQIALLHSDADLIGAIDEIVHQGKVALDDVEIRVSKVRRWDRAERYPQAQIGALGARFTAPPNTKLVADRMLRILHKLYYESEFLDAGDLAYAIEAPNGLSSGELLNLAVRGNSIEKLLRDLILPNRRAVEITAKELCIFDYETLPREQVLKHMRWKIGEPVAVGFPDLRRIDEYLTRVQTANDGYQSHDLIREAASPLFAAVEDALNRSLIFCIWAFTTDHYLSKDGFVYDPGLDRSIVDFIETNAPTSEPELRLKAAKNTLAPLGAGFPRLAKALRSLDEGIHARAQSEIPAPCIASSRQFAFLSTRMFFNLTDSAQAEVLTSLQTIGRHAQNGDVIDVRNWTSHGDRPFPGADRIRVALKHIAELRHCLHISGLYPRVYELVSLARDSVGREELIYESDGERLPLFRPLWAIAPRLPMGQTALVIVSLANTDSSGPLRFRLKPTPGTDPYWAGWPKRWPSGKTYYETQQVLDDRTGLAEAG